MITTEQAKYLIGLPKKIVENDIPLESKSLEIQQPFSERFYMLSDKDDEYSFFLNVKQSTKLAIKFSLHYQEEDADYGLLRVDFNGRHKNPEIANEHVPQAFLPFTGQWLDDYQGHIHYVINGYKPLSWAIPLEIDNFPVKKVVEFTDIVAAFQEFCKIINIETKIVVNTQSKLFI